MEDFFECFAAVSEDFLQHGADEERMGQFTEGLEREGVVDGVGDFTSGAREGGYEMAMTPEFVGT